MSRSSDPLRTIVTGGSGAIGQAILRAVSERGDAVVNLDQTASDRAHWIETNLTDSGSVERAVEAAVSYLGGVDVLIHSAGVFEAVPFLELDEDDFRRVLDINLLGSFRISKAVALRMQQDGGRILFLSSIHAKYGIRGRLAYGASKAGIEAMTRTIAAEMSANGVRVNALACGAVDTGMSATKALRTDWAGATPAGRKVTAQEVANLARVLTGDDASFVSGQVISQDGGASTAQIFGGS